MKPRKLVRTEIAKILKPGEVDQVTDRDELNDLYAMKAREEVREITMSGCNDIYEFADLIDAAFTWAEVNGFTEYEILSAILHKQSSRGKFTNLVLNNLNPNNPSNAIYFDTV